MEEFDSTIDTMLKKRARALKGQAVECAGFDADMASAYLEQALAPTEMERYQLHLSECHPCRTQMIELSNLFAQPVAEPSVAAASVVEAPITRPAVVDEERRSVFEVVREWLFGPQTRWAFAAIVIALLAGAIWWVSNRQTQNPNDIIADKPQTPTAPVNQPAPNNSVQPPNQPAPNNEVTPQVVQQTPKTNENKQDKGNVQAPAPQPQQPNNNELANVPQPQEKKPEVNLPNAPTPKVDIATNDGKGTQLPVTPNNEVAQLPPPPDKKDERITPPNRPKKGDTGVGGVGFEEVEIADTKKVGGKTFNRIKGVWIDEQYNPERDDQRANTLVRNSEAYKQAVKANPALKRFAEVGANVKVVYNGVAYIIKP